MFNRLVNALVQLWSTRGELNFNSIRKSHLRYTIAFIFCITLADMQFSFFICDAKLWNIDSTTLTYSAYCLAAAVILIIRQKRFKLYCLSSSIITIAGFVLWMLLPEGEARLIALILCMSGLGGCAACSTYTYAFVLNNAERLFGIMLITFNTSLLFLIYEFEVKNILLETLIPIFLVLAIAFCILKFSFEEIEKTSKNTEKPIPKGAILILSCVVIYFTINIFGDVMLRASNGRAMFATGMLLSIIVAVMVKLIFHFSIWHLWNIFLVFSTLGSVLMSIGSSQNMFSIGAFIFGLASGNGYISIFYWGGGFVKKSESHAFFKRAMFCTVVIGIIPIVASGIIMSAWPEVLFLITPVLAGASLFIFMLFSPAFYNSYFGSDSMDDFHMIDISIVKERFSDLGLTAREKEVLTLLLEGYTLRQISGVMGIAYSTVNTYCTSLYRKLEVNSRVELFVRFGTESKSK